MSNKKPKLTPWFPGKLLPARKSVYERKIEGHISYSFWDGRYWMFMNAFCNIAANEVMISCWQKSQWRGLAVKP